VRTPEGSFHLGNHRAISSLALAKTIARQKLRAEADRLARKIAELRRIRRAL
jgi:hypothetical protein